MSYLKKRIQAFGFAFAGLKSAFANEVHLKLHFMAAVMVIITGIYFKLGRWEWIAISGCITLVISLELINSAIEQLCNLVMPGQSPKIKYIKDVCAAAVLIACIFSVLTAIAIFWPHIQPWLN